MATRTKSRGRTSRAATAAPPAPAGSANANGHSPAAPRSIVVTKRGVRSGADFADLMSALMGDVIEGTITPNVANAACNAGRQLLRITEMQYRYGGEKSKPLMLAPGNGRR